MERLVGRFTLMLGVFLASIGFLIVMRIGYALLMIGLMLFLVGRRLHQQRSTQP